MPSNLRMMESMKVLWGATCPLRTGIVAPTSSHESRATGAGRATTTTCPVGGDDDDQAGRPAAGEPPPSHHATGTTTVTAAGEGVSNGGSLLGAGRRIVRRLSAQRWPPGPALRAPSAAAAPPAVAAAATVRGCRWERRHSLHRAACGAGDARCTQLASVPNNILGVVVVGLPTGRGQRIVVLPQCDRSHPVLLWSSKQSEEAANATTPSSHSARTGYRGGGGGLPCECVRQPRSLRPDTVAPRRGPGCKPQRLERRDDTMLAVLGRVPGQHS